MRGDGEEEKARLLTNNSSPYSKILNNHSMLSILTCLIQFNWPSVLCTSRHSEILLVFLPC